MKLLTHNMLACHIKGVKNNFPLLIEAAKVEAQDADYNPGLVQHVAAAGAAGKHGQLCVVRHSARPGMASW